MVPILSMFLTFLSIITVSTCGEVPEVEVTPNETTAESGSTAVITVTYDNNRYDDRLKTAWGFSALVESRGKTILFDTGGDSPTLLNNMEKLEIDPEEVDIVVLSHIHGDHVGGLAGFLKKNSDVTVYIPRSFPEDFKGRAKAQGASVESIYEPRGLLEGAYSTGELTNRVREQGLILDVESGIMVITGCAHPGIVKIVERAKEVVKKDVLLVMGGFHLGGKSDREIEQIIADFRRLGVRYAGPCHCSGDKARTLFQKAYGEDFLELGVGSVIRIDDGQVK
jgi:7,8-dihydropterin-6-yl-methyl-4-(beta-D-ribofuranosyl)aminobenzene 5'-phosphate synthase